MAQLEHLLASVAHTCVAGKSHLHQSLLILHCTSNPDAITPVYCSINYAYLATSWCFLQDDGAFIPRHCSHQRSAVTLYESNGSSRAARGISCSVNSTTCSSIPHSVRSRVTNSRRSRSAITHWFKVVLVLRV